MALLYKDKVKKVVKEIVIRKEGYIIQFNNISKNFSREKLKLLTLRLINNETFNNHIVGW